MSSAYRYMDEYGRPCQYPDPESCANEAAYCYPPSPIAPVSGNASLHIHPQNHSYYGFGDFSNRDIGSQVVGNSMQHPVNAYNPRPSATTSGARPSAPAPVAPAPVAPAPVAPAPVAPAPVAPAPVAPAVVPIAHPTHNHTNVASGAPAAAAGPVNINHAAFYAQPPPHPGPPWLVPGRAVGKRHLTVPYPPPGNVCHFAGCYHSGFLSHQEFQAHADSHVYQFPCLRERCWKNNALYQNDYKLKQHGKEQHSKYYKDPQHGKPYKKGPNFLVFCPLRPNCPEDFINKEGLHEHMARRHPGVGYVIDEEAAEANLT